MDECLYIMWKILYLLNHVFLFGPLGPVHTTDLQRERQRERERERDRQRERQTERERDRERQRQTNR